MFHCGDLKLRKNNNLFPRLRERVQLRDQINPSLKIVPFRRMLKDNFSLSLGERSKNPCEQSEILRSSSTDLLQSNRLSLRMTSALDKSGKLCHAELVSASLAGAYGQRFRNKFGMTINHNKFRHPERSEGSQTEQMIANYGIAGLKSEAKFAKESTSSQPSPQGEGERSCAERIGNFPSPREEGIGERVLLKEQINPSLKKCAFTLTEVLIAVFIVGVIAAIILPMVITSYQNNVLNYQYTREVQSIEDVVNTLAVSENKTTFFSTMMYSDSEPSSYEENAGLFIKKYFKVAKYCGENNGNCFASTYYTYKDNLRKVYTPKYKGACAKLKNGMSICVIPQIGNLGVHGLLDLNGLRGPNVLGRDLREFSIDPLERSAIGRETSEVYYEDYLVPSKDESKPDTPPTPPTPPEQQNPCTENPSSIDCCKTKKITSPSDKCCTYTEIKNSTPACIDTSISITFKCNKGTLMGFSGSTVSSCEFNATGYEADTYLVFIPFIDKTKRDDYAFSCTVSGAIGSKACCGLNDYAGYVAGTCRDPGDMSLDKRVFSNANKSGSTHPFCSRKAELWQYKNGVYKKIKDFSDTVTGVSYHSK